MTASAKVAVLGQLQHDVAAALRIFEDAPWSPE